MRSGNFIQIVNDIIDNLEKRSETDESNFERALLSQIYDKDFGMTQKLYEKALETNKVDGIMINMFAWSAAYFKKQDFLSQILYQAAI